MSEQSPCPNRDESRAELAGSQNSALKPNGHEPEVLIDTRQWMTHMAAPFDMVAERGWKNGWQARVPVCPICRERCRIDTSDTYQLWREKQRCAIPAGTGAALQVAPETGSLGIAIPLICESGHPFTLMVLQILTDMAVHFDVVVSEDLYEQHPELFENTGGAR